MRKSIIFLLAFLACIAAFYLSERYHRNKAKNAFNASVGILDNHAEKALQELQKIQWPNTQDQFLSARLIDLNGHEGRINNVRVLNKVVHKYMDNLRPYVEPHNMAKDNLDWFELDQIENFADRHMDIMVANPQYNDFIDAVLQARPKKVVKTLDEVKESSKTKSEAFETYVANNVVHTNDNQNVHDSAVNEHLRQTWQVLKNDVPSVSFDATVKNIQEYIQQAGEPAKQKRALHALEEIRKNKFNGTLGATEGDVLGAVWNRAEHPANCANATLIRNAVVDSLSDMTFDGVNVVCSNGRCARLMESLVHTDADSGLMSGAMTVEQIRNDAFVKSNEILQETVESLSSGRGGNPALTQVALSYKDPTVQTDPTAEQQFKELVKGRVNSYLQSTYAGKLSRKDYNNIRDHCVTAIETI